VIEAAIVCGYPQPESSTFLTEAHCFLLLDLE